MSDEEKNKTGESRVGTKKLKRIQFSAEGQYLIGTDSMITLVTKISSAGYDLNDLFVITQDGIIIEQRSKEIDDPDIAYYAQSLFLNQLSVRSVIDNQTIARLIASENARKGQVQVDGARESSDRGTDKEGASAQS